jgi:hypothetical protein
MKLDPFTVNVIGENFSHLVVEGKTSGSIAFLSFKDTREMTPLLSAVLLPANTNVTLLYDADSAAYPIFFAAGEVEIEFRTHVDTIKNKYTWLAFITSRSPDGKKMTRVHGL